MKLDRSHGWVLAFAGGLRLLWALIVPMRPTSDGLAYLTFAQNLTAGGAFGWDAAIPDAFWPPGTSFLYSLFLRAFGSSLVPIVLGNWLLSMSVVVLTMQLVRDWQGPRPALLAGWLLALWPLQIELVTILASELPFTVAMLIALRIAGTRLPSWPRVVGLGVWIAIASYLRPTALLFPGGLALVALWRREAWLPALGRTAAVVLVAAALIAPWTLRNYQVFGRFVPVAANSGANLWMGNNPDSVGEYMPVPKELKALDRASQDAILGDRAIEWMISHPGSAALLAVRKLSVTHGRETIGVVWNAEGLGELGVGERGRLVLAAISTAYWYAACLAGLAGLTLALRREGLGSLPAVFWIYFAAVHAITVAMDRYHVPSIPFVAWLGACAWIEWEPWIRERFGWRAARDDSA